MIQLTAWCYNCKDGSEKCLTCHNTSQDKPHNAKDCPSLKKIGLKLVKHSLADTDAASCISNDGPPPTQLPTPVLAPPFLIMVGRALHLAYSLSQLNLAVTIRAMILIIRANTRARCTTLAPNLLVWQLTLTRPFPKKCACKFQLRQTPLLYLLPLWHAMT